MSRNKKECYDEQSSELHCVMITEESCLKTDHDEDCQPFICHLRHPCSGTAALFMFTDGFKRVNELMVFDEDGHRSWFVNSRVLSDGRLIVTTPMEPLFLILPYLIKASVTGRFMSVETLLDDSEFRECQHLSTCCDHEDISNVADIRHSDDGMVVCRYNAEKTLSWLKTKVNDVVNGLQRHDIKVTMSSSASLATFVDVNASCDYMKYAHGIIADYLPPDLSVQLANSLGIKEDDVTTSYADDDLPSGKRSNVDQPDVAVPLEDYSTFASAPDNNKNVKMTAAQKQLSKVNKTGIKSISSFFTRSATKS